MHRFEHADQWAKEFDDPARDAWQRPKEVVELMAIERGMRVADVGAGTGYFEPWLSRAVGDTGVVHALDIEPDMVRYLTDRARRESLTNVRPGLVSTDDPKLPVGLVDRILIVDTWHHIADRGAYARKLFRALSSKGRLYVVDFTLEAQRGPPPGHRLAPEAVVRELSSAGFVARVVSESLPDQYVVEGTPGPALNP